MVADPPRTRSRSSFVKTVLAVGSLGGAIEVIVVAGSAGAADAVGLAREVAPAGAALLYPTTGG